MMAADREDGYAYLTDGTRTVWITSEWVEGEAPHAAVVRAFADLGMARDHTSYRPGLVPIGWDDSDGTGLNAFPYLWVQYGPDGLPVRYVRISEIEVRGSDATVEMPVNDVRWLAMRIAIECERLAGVSWITRLSEPVVTATELLSELQSVFGRLEARARGEVPG